MTETEWQQQVVQAARLFGWSTNHTRRTLGRGRKWTTGTSTVGFPDLTLWSERHRRLIFAELKTDRGKLTPEQESVIASLRAAGCECHVWRPSDWSAVELVLRGAA